MGFSVQISKTLGEKQMYIMYAGEKAKQLQDHQPIRDVAKIAPLYVIVSVLCILYKYTISSESLDVTTGSSQFSSKWGKFYGCGC